LKSLRMTTTLRAADIDQPFIHRQAMADDGSFASATLVVRSGASTSTNNATTRAVQSPGAF
jgi:hypothetical protein